MQGVDNAAHIGGLAGGLVLGWLVGRHSLDATPSPRLTVIPIVMTAAIAAAAVLSVGARQDLRAEAARVGMQIDRAEAAFRVARADIAAGKRTRADVADEAETTVLALIHDGQGRADDMLRAAMAQVSAVGADRDGLIEDSKVPPGVRARKLETHRWAVCLARYDDAWRRRVAGLRAGDAAGVADGDARAAATIREVSKILAGS
jgi:hypothetical protein